MSGCLRNQQTISNSELTQRLLLLRGETLVKQRSLSDFKMVMVMMKNIFLMAMTATGMMRVNKKFENFKNLIHVIYFGQNLNGYNLTNNGSNYWRRAKLILSCKSSFSWYPNVVTLPTDAFSSLQEISSSFCCPFVLVGPIDTVLKLL